MSSFIPQSSIARDFIIASVPVLEKRTFWQNSLVSLVVENHLMSLQYFGRHEEGRKNKGRLTKGLKGKCRITRS